MIRRDSPSPLKLFLLLPLLYQGGLQEVRRSAVHAERTGQLQPGDVLQRGGERRREGCMDQGLEGVDVEHHAAELGRQLADQRRLPEPAAIVPARARRREDPGVLRRCTLKLEPRGDLRVPDSILVAED